MKNQNFASASTESARAALREPDGFVQETVAAARANWDRCRSEATDYAKREPEKALVSALAAGYVLRMLPLAGILSMVIRFALALIRPVAFLYGGAKLWQKTQDAPPRTPQERP